MSPPPSLALSSSPHPRSEIVDCAFVFSFLFVSFSSNFRTVLSLRFGFLVHFFPSHSHVSLLISPSTLLSCDLLILFRASFLIALLPVHKFFHALVFEIQLYTSFPLRSSRTPIPRLSIYKKFRFRWTVSSSPTFARVSGVGFSLTRTFLCLFLSSSLSDGTVDTQCKHKRLYQKGCAGRIWRELT
jgi:hypothetical protein